MMLSAPLGVNPNVLMPSTGCARDQRMMENWVVSSLLLRKKKSFSLQALVATYGITPSSFSRTGETWLMNTVESFSHFTRVLLICRWMKAGFRQTSHGGKLMRNSSGHEWTAGGRKGYRGESKPDSAHPESPLFQTDSQTPAKTAFTNCSGDKLCTMALKH